MSPTRYLGSRVEVSELALVKYYFKMIICKMLYNIIRNYRAQGVIGTISLSVPVELLSHVSLSETVWDLVWVSKQDERKGAG